MKKLFIVTLVIRDRRTSNGLNYKSFSRQSDYIRYVKRNPSKVTGKALAHFSVSDELTRMSLEEVDALEWQYK